MITSWNDAEDEALRRLTWRARIAYLQGIRRHMDYATGLSGIARVLSYRFFIELLGATDCTTEPDPEVTKRMLQRTFEALERVGLVRWKRGAASQRGVVFECLLADREHSVQKQAVPKRYPSGTQEAVPIAVRGDADSGDIAVPIHVAVQHGQAVPPQESGKKEKKNTSVGGGEISGSRARFSPPSVEAVALYCRSRGNTIDPQRFVDYYCANGWAVGRGPMKDWKAAVRYWEASALEKPNHVPRETAVERRERINAEFIAAGRRAAQAELG